MPATSSSSPVRVQDEQLDFTGGINSNVVTTIASQRNPNGLKRNQLAWQINSTVRSGGVHPRTGWKFLATISDGSKPWEFGSMYDQISGNPYLVCQIGGQIIIVHTDTDNSVVNLSTTFGLTNPTPVPRTFWAQGKNFLICQPGDFGLVPSPTKPLFWDGTTLRRSLGIISSGNIPPAPPPYNEIPPATCMVYYMNRMWYAQGQQYSAGDIDGGTTEIINVTENPLAIGGDGFAVPTNAGQIRALAYTASLDSALGQGPLYVFTRKQIYQMIVPVTRFDWINANANNLPLQTIAQIVNGAVNDTSVVAVNGDLFYQTLLPSIASLIAAIRYYSQWGNTPISSNENRVLALNDRALLKFASGIEFDNRVLQTALPQQTTIGTIHSAIIPLDFDVISSLEEKKAPVWEGVYEMGFGILQLFTADFGGLQRAFAVARNSKDGSIELWEITNAALSDTNSFGESRINWAIETPAFTCGDENQFKTWDNAEMWFDHIEGTAIIKVEFRMDGDECWHLWHEFKVCEARNSAESGEQVYPVIENCAQDRRPVVLPRVPKFDCNLGNNRPINQGYQMQVRFTIKGYLRIRSIRVFAFPTERPHYYGIVC